MKRIIAAVVLSAALVPPANAVRVFGSVDCAQWLSWRKDDVNFAEVWLLGFLSAFNLLNATKDSDPLVGVNPEQFNVWMDNFCRANPLESIGIGAQRLYAELTTRLLRKSKQ